MNTILLPPTYDLTDPTQKLIAEAMCCYPNVMKMYYRDLKKGECGCKFKKAFLIKEFAKALWNNIQGSTSLTDAQINTISKKLRKLMDICKDCKNLYNVITNCELAQFEMVYGGTIYGAYIHAASPFPITGNYTFSWYYAVDDNEDLIPDDGEWVFIDTTEKNYINIGGAVDEVAGLISFRCVVTCPDGVQRELVVARTDDGQVTNFLFYSLKNSKPTYIPTLDEFPDLFFIEGQELVLINRNPDEYEVTFQFDSDSQQVTANSLTLELSDMAAIYMNFPDDSTDHNYVEHFTVSIEHLATGILFGQEFSIQCMPKPVITGNEIICFGSSSTLTANYGSAGTQYDVYDTYQWYKNGTIIGGATSATYDATTAGDYTVRCSLNGEMLESESLTLAMSNSHDATVRPAIAADLIGTPQEGDSIADYWEYNDVLYVISDTVNVVLIVEDSYAGYPALSTVEWVNYTIPTIELYTYAANQPDTYSAIVTMPGSEGGCVFTSNSVDLDFSVLNALDYGGSYLQNGGGGVHDDITSFGIDPADRLIVVTDNGNGTWDLDLQQSPRTGYDYNYGDSNSGSWRKIFTATHPYSSQSGTEIQADSNTVTVNESGFYGFLPDEIPGEVIGTGDGSDVTFNYTIVDTTKILPAYVSIGYETGGNPEGLTCVDSGVASSNFYHSDGVTVAGTLNKTTGAIVLNLDAAYIPDNLADLTVYYGYQAATGQKTIIALVQ